MKKKKNLIEDEEINYGRKKKRKKDKPYIIESRRKIRMPNLKGKSGLWEMGELTDEWGEWKADWKKFAKETDAMAWIRKTNSENKVFKTIWIEYRLKPKED